jgi:hypothetical protein
MAPVKVFACVVLLSGSPSLSQAEAAPRLADLRWVSGAVVERSPDSITLTLQNSSLTLSVGAETKVITARGAPASPTSEALAGIAIGSKVKVHYVERPKKQMVAVLMIDDASVNPAPLSKGPGDSAWGIVITSKAGRLSVRSDGRSHAFTVDGHTMLVDREGHRIATGRDAIAPLVSAGAELLVTYQTEWVTDGEGSVTAVYERAVEIRTLTPVAGR